MPPEHSKLVEHWTKAAQDLGLEIEAPFAMSLDSGVRFQADVLVRRFGGTNGMVIVTDYSESRHYWSELGERGYGVSVEPEPPADQGYDREELIRILIDWGWSGPEAETPQWYLRAEQAKVEEQAHFLSQAARFLEQQLTAVRYVLWGDDEEPHWERNLCDSAGRGVLFETVGGPILGVMTNWERYCLDLLIIDGGVERISQGRAFDVANSSRWQPLIGDRITDVQIYWQNSVDQRLYPQDAVLTLTADQRQDLSPQIMMLVFQSGKRIFIMHDPFLYDRKGWYRTGEDIGIAFNEDAAEKLGIGPYARPPRTIEMVPFYRETGGRRVIQKILTRLKQHECEDMVVESEAKDVWVLSIDKNCVALAREVVEQNIGLEETTIAGQD